MFKWLGTAYAWIAGRPMLAGANTVLMKLGAKGLGLLNYESQAVGGEVWFLKHYLKNLSSPLVFDVGANQGNWSAKVMRVNPRAVVYAFEPHPVTYRLLRNRCPNLATVNCALGAQCGTSRLFDYADRQGSSHASLVSGVIELVHGQLSIGIDVPVTTVDHFCEEKAIQSIDLVKIDTEGYELAVIQGALGMLAGRRIRAIQFEFNEIHAMSRTFVQDIVDAIGPHFQLYRLLSHGLLKLDQQSRWQREQFVYQNLVAMLADERQGK